MVAIILTNTSTVFNFKFSSQKVLDPVLSVTINPKNKNNNVNVMRNNHLKTGIQTTPKRCISNISQEMDDIHHNDRIIILHPNINL